MQKNTKRLTKSEGLKKMMRYCAYQDRCQQEVRQKLNENGLFGDDAEEIIFDLITHDFLNEERFAKSYARGKFNYKSWGRNKILNQLAQKDISEYCQRKAMEEIEPEAYQKKLEELLEMKMSRIKATSIYEHRDKAARFAIQKGYEPELVWQILKNNYPK